MAMRNPTWSRRILDNLPIAIVRLREDNGQPFKTYERGFPVGRVEVSQPCLSMSGFDCSAARSLGPHAKLQSLEPLKSPRYLSCRSQLSPEAVLSVSAAAGDVHSGCQALLQGDRIHSEAKALCATECFA